MFKLRVNIPEKPPPNRPDIIQYNNPVLKDMAIILVYFNPCKYRRIMQNALTIKHIMDCAKIPYFIAETKHSSDANYLFAPDDNIFQYCSNSYIFYKENLIKIAETKIPDRFTKICILDFDIFFDNPDWYSIVSEKLNSVQVVQPFKRAHYLNLDYTVYETKTNCVDNKTTAPIDYAIEHSGFVWAFNREWFKSYDFDDMMLTSMGDTIFANNVTKRAFVDIGSFFYYKYRKSAVPYTQDILYDSCDLDVYHLNHGPLINRQYTNINYILKLTFLKYKINAIDKIMVRNSEGILEYHADYANIFNNIMLTYFKNRDDDSSRLS